MFQNIYEYVVLYVKTFTFMEYTEVQKYLDSNQIINLSFYILSFTYSKHEITKYKNFTDFIIQKKNTFRPEEVFLLEGKINLALRDP